MLDNLQSDDRILVLSPHLDDAVLSVGGIMHRAASSGATVVAATVCTADAPANIGATATIREKHAAWGLGSNPFLARREEDIAAVHLLGATHLHGGMLDAIYRTKADGGFLYPTPASRYSTPDQHDPLFAWAVELIADWVRAVCPNVVLCPLGVGRHVDHVIVSQTFRSFELDRAIQVFLYEDMPYSVGYYGSQDGVSAAIERSGWTVSEPLGIAVDVEAKVAAVLRYSSQATSLFPDGRHAEHELRTYMLRSDHFEERVWSVLR